MDKERTTQWKILKKILMRQNIVHVLVIHSYTGRHSSLAQYDGRHHMLSGQSLFITYCFRRDISRISFNHFWQDIFTGSMFWVRDLYLAVLLLSESQSLSVFSRLSTKCQHTFSSVTKQFYCMCTLAAQ